MALVNQSGARGLAAFLPDRVVVLAVAGGADEKQPPHLPLTQAWRDTDFGMASVVNAAPGRVVDGRVSMRTWTMLLLSRYLYMSGEFWMTG